MRLFCAALLMALFLSALPPAAASHCGVGYFLGPATPMGVTQDPMPIIRIVFHDTPETCGIASSTMLVDGVAVPHTASIVGTDYVLEHVPAAPLAAGPHVVEATLVEECCSTSGSSTAQTSWAFVVDPVGSASDGVSNGGISVKTPATVGTPLVCAIVVCVPPQLIPVGSIAGASVAIDSVSVGYAATPLRTAVVGPFDVGGVILCPMTCFVPDPALDVSASTRVHGTVSIAGTDVPYDVPVTLP